MQPQLVETSQPIFDSQKMMIFARKSVAHYQKQKAFLEDKTQSVPISQEVHTLAQDLFQSVWNEQKKSELSWVERFQNYASCFEAFRKEMKEAVHKALKEQDPPQSPLTIARTSSEDSLEDHAQPDGTLSLEYAHTTNYLFSIDGQHAELKGRSEHELHMKIEEFMSDLSRDIDDYDMSSIESFQSLDARLEAISNEFGLSQKQLVPYIYGAFQHKEKRANADLKKAQVLFSSYKDRITSISIKMAELEGLLQPNSKRNGTAIRKSIREIMDLTGYPVETVVQKIRQHINQKYSNQADIHKNLDQSVIKSVKQKRLLIAGSLFKREYASSKAVIVKKLE